MRNFKVTGLTKKGMGFVIGLGNLWDKSMIESRKISDEPFVYEFKLLNRDLQKVVTPESLDKFLGQFIEKFSLKVKKDEDFSTEVFE